MPDLMTLKVILPNRMFSETSGVMRIVAESKQGSFGILPHRLDCVSDIVPGIISYETETAGELFLAVDQGVLVKCGMDVTISVREAIGGSELESLRDFVDKEYLKQDEQELKIRVVMDRIDAKLIRNLVEFKHD